MASYDEFCTSCEFRLALQQPSTNAEDEVIGVVLKNKRRIRTILKRQRVRQVRKPRKKRELTLRLSTASRLAKWEAFENADIDRYVLQAAAAGYEVCLVTLKLPVREWLPYAPTPSILKEGLNRWMRKTGGKRRFGLPGHNKPVYCFNVLEFKVEGDKAPHFHLVMMLPPHADETIRELWRSQLGLPKSLTENDVAHVSRKYYDPADPIESFRRASRYLCRKKSLQEVVCPLWVEAKLEVGNMWAVRGFLPYPDEEYELRQRDVVPTKTVLESVSTRPRYRVDELSGELKRNYMPRHQIDSPNGNTEILGDRTDEVFSQIAAQNGWS
ncbi:hypothetical protein [Pseudarthrobacter niigatensis]|uniref:Replication protein n=1 Tax=Pseudarthrobacter niigatensis TaxID=369935 RepID=A0AAJ1WFY5_9MICC|nr:hypothetical protein [Pseudarthrobacter niigatensis]MDQ0144973.1 hypothetical protein [Pseudarthrobacter niigatensis]MDQ0264410.1 hypothetical protein [Pseudarthrobacter niigatensis]